MGFKFCSSVHPRKKAHVAAYSKNKGPLKEAPIGSDKKKKKDVQDKFKPILSTKLVNVLKSIFVNIFKYTYEILYLSRPKILAPSNSAALLTNTCMGEIIIII